MESQNENKLYISGQIIDQLPLMVKSELAKMPAQKQELFMEEYKRKAKSTGLAYLCWFFGFHYAYMGNIGLLIVFWLTFCGLGIWWLIDVFRVSGLVRNHNMDVASDAMRTLKAMSS